MKSAQVHISACNDVLPHILSYLEFEELKTASLVCTTWLTFVQKIMSKRARFRFHFANIEDFLQEPDKGNSEFESIRNKIREHPVSLNLDIVCSSTCTPEQVMDKKLNIESAKNLFSILSSRKCDIADLKLTFYSCDIPKAWNLLCTIYNQIQNLNIVVKLCKKGISIDENDETINSYFRAQPAKFLKLKKLIGKQGNEGGDDSKQKIFYRQLMANSPNLEELHCQLHSHEMFEVLKENPDSLQQLESISHISLNQEELKTLINKKLGLKSITFTLHSGFRVPELHTFLSSQACSLESLDINFQTLPRIPEQFMAGADLINMKHLCLKKFYGSVHFVSHMPHLKTLCLEDVNLSVALHDESLTHYYKSDLESLAIFGGRGSTGRFLFPAVYYDIVRFFPALKKLRMEYFTDTTLKIIIKGLPNIEELNIPNGIYSDIVIAKQRISDECDANETQQNDSDVKELNCISDLKSLKKLILQSPKITDASILGLLTCRELKSLSIDSPMISNNGLLSLCKSPYLFQVELINCYQLTLDGIKQAKQLWGTGRQLEIVNK